MEEFLDSPLIKIKNSSWFTRMSSEEMKDLIASMGDDDRPVFLALLKPQRVRSILDTCTNTKDREVIIGALANIDRVTEDQIAPFLEKLTESRKTQSQSIAKKGAVDSAKYIAQIIAELPDAEQQTILASVARNPQLNAGLRDHFIPFAMIKAVPNELILEIFGERPDNQIATMLFDSSDDVRNRVIESLPELKREGVKDELKLLEGNKFYEKRYRMQSSALQKEVTQYLLMLYQEGLISFGNDGQGSDNGNKAA
jgi:Mg/Co/Ni transporter MgtE